MIDGDTTSRCDKTIQPRRAADSLVSLNNNVRFRRLCKKTIAMSWGIVSAQLRKCKKWLKLPDDFGLIETVGHRRTIFQKLVT